MQTRRTAEAPSSEKNGDVYITVASSRPGGTDLAVGLTQPTTTIESIIKQGERRECVGTLCCLLGMAFLGAAGYLAYRAATSWFASTSGPTQSSDGPPTPSTMPTLAPGALNELDSGVSYTAAAVAAFVLMLGACCFGGCYATNKACHRPSPIDANTSEAVKNTFIRFNESLAGALEGVDPKAREVIALLLTRRTVRGEVNDLRNDLVNWEKRAKALVNEPENAFRARYDATGGRGFWSKQDLAKLVNELPYLHFTKQGGVGRGDGLDPVVAVAGSAVTTGVVVTDAISSCSIQ